MLGKALIKKLSKQIWVEALKNDSNPTQTWARTRSKAERALKHLKILADTLPDDKQDILFSVESVCTLLDSILRQPVWADPKSDKLDIRRSKLAATIAERSLNKCIDQFKNVEKSEDISKLVITRLQESIGLCRGIAEKARPSGLVQHIRKR
jgi:hypothetical protein